MTKVIYIKITSGNKIKSSHRTKNKTNLDIIYKLSGTKKKRGEQKRKNLSILPHKHDNQKSAHPQSDRRQFLNTVTDSEIRDLV